MYRVFCIHNQSIQQYSLVMRSTRSGRGAGKERNGKREKLLPLLQEQPPANPKSARSHYS